MIVLSGDVSLNEVLETELVAERRDQTQNPTDHYWRLCGLTWGFQESEDQH